MPLDSKMQFIEIFAKCIKKVGVEYYQQGTDLTIDVKDGQLSIREISGVFEKDIIEQAILIKLEHNIQMLKSFADNYQLDTSSWGFNDFMLNENDNFMIKLHIDTRSVNVVEKSGYGLIFTNMKKLLATLMLIPTSLKSHIAELSKVKEKKYLERIVSFDWTKLPSNSSFDEVMEKFVMQDFDYFKSI